MRLGQIAKKLGVRPTEIVALLRERNLPVSEGSNNRLTEEQVRLVMDHWPTPDIALFGQPETFTEQSDTEDGQPEMVADEDITAPENPAASVESHEESEPPVEVIRAPKVELSGLKVIGKIELPETRKKDKVKPKGETERNTKAGERGYRRGTKKNPIALQREREEREAQEKRRNEESLAKEIRTQRYLEKRNATAPVKPAKKRKQAETSENKPQESTPNTWFGRFWKWYRS